MGGDAQPRPQAAGVDNDRGLTQTLEGELSHLQMLPITDKETLHTEGGFIMDRHVSNRSGIAWDSSGDKGGTISCTTQKCAMTMGNARNSCGMNRTYCPEVPQFLGFE